MTRFRTLVVAALVAVATFGLLVAVWGYDSSHGAGTGSGSAGTTQAVTLQAATGTPATLLIPSSTATSDLVVTLTNPNGVSVTVVGISQGGSVTAVGGAGVCTTTGVSVPTLTGLNIAVAKGPGSVTIHIPNGVTMDATSQSGCQGASFHIPLTVTVQR